MSFRAAQQRAGRRTECKRRGWLWRLKRMRRTHWMTRVVSLLALVLILGVALAFMLAYSQRRSAQQASLSSKRVSLEAEAQTNAASPKKQNARQIFSQETKEVSGDLTQAATQVLKHYQRLNDSIVVRYGYLDLQGNVWSCTFQTKEGVSIVFVSRHSKQTSRISTVRLTKDAVRKAYQG